MADQKRLGVIIELQAEYTFLPGEHTQAQKENEQRYADPGRHPAGQNTEGYQCPTHKKQAIDRVQFSAIGYELG